MATKATKASGDWVDSILSDNMEAQIEQALTGDAPKADFEERKPTKKEKLPEDWVWFSDKFWKPTEVDDFRIMIGDAAPHERAIPDPDYIPPRKEFEIALWAMCNGMVPRIIGKPGTGKTVMSEFIAATLNRPYLRLIGNLQADTDQIWGKTVLQAGETHHRKNGIALYNDRPSVIFVDEPTAYDPALYFAVFQPYLESRILRIQAEGILIPPHEQLMVMAADNALGLGENGDKYPTRNVQDVSTLNRWPVTLHLEYMDFDTTKALIQKKAPELPTHLTDKLARLTKLLQGAYDSGTIPLSFSARQFIPIAKMAVAFRDLKKAFEVNFVNSLDEDSRAVVREVYAGL
jgi:MoxR-like ATPase